MVDALQDYAAQLSSCRIKSDTRSKYSKYQVKIIGWFVTNHPEFVDGSSAPAKLRLEAITPVAVGELLASCVINGKHDKDGNTKPYSAYHLSAYRSAFKSMYKDVKVDVPRAVEMQMQNCMKGYKNKVAGYKSDGLLKSTEGARPLTNDAYRYDLYSNFIAA
jgi:hypothetical protein